MSMNITSPNPAWISLGSTGWNSEGLMPYKFVIKFKYSPPNDVISVRVTDTASNSILFNPYQGLESNGSPSFAGGYGYLLVNFSIPETLLISH